MENIYECLKSGEWIYAGAKDFPDVGEKLSRSAEMCFEINSLPPSRSEERTGLFRRLLGSAGDSFIIHSPFRCDFGFNIHIGENFIGNFNLAILDEAPVRIGDNVMIGPNCSLVTILHAFDARQRNEGIMKAKPITVGDNVWIAANVVVLPGVEIGEGAIIGAGSVVVKSIPANSLAVGNPCRVIRTITDDDRIAPELIANTI